MATSVKTQHDYQSEYDRLNTHHQRVLDSSMPRTREARNKAMVYINDLEKRLNKAYEELQASKKTCPLCSGELIKTISLNSEMNGYHKHSKCTQCIYDLFLEYV